MLSVAHCCCGETEIVGCINCRECQIPGKTLEFSWGGAYYGGGIALEIWNGAYSIPPGLGIQWDDVSPIWYGCLEVGGNAYRIGFGCKPGTINGHWLLEWGGAAACDSLSNGEYCSTEGGTIALVNDYTCNPFHVHYQSGCGTLAGFLGTTDFYINDTTPLTVCPPPHDLPRVCSPKILGCNGLPLVGAHVVIKDSGGSILASGDTGSDGIFASGLAEAHYWVTVSKARFNTTTFSDFSCSGITAIDMSGHLADGYHCLSLCADPVADVLHATHPIFGAQTYTYAASGIGGPGWYMPETTRDVPTCLDCPEKIVTVNSFLLTNGTFHDWWNTVGHCPDDGGGGITPVPVQTNWTSDSVTCPPSFSMTFEFTFYEEIQYYFFCSTDTFTVVITE